MLREVVGGAALWSAKLARERWRKVVTATSEQCARGFLGVLVVVVVLLLLFFFFFFFVATVAANKW